MSVRVTDSKLAFGLKDYVCPACDMAPSIIHTEERWIKLMYKMEKESMDG